MKTIIIDGVEYNLTPKVAFREGDWVVNTITHYVEQIIGITNNVYICSECSIVSFENQHLLKKWTIQDAKDGDVIVNGSNIFIFHFINDTRLIGYCHVNTDDGRFYDDIGKNECFCLIDAIVHPATKEQRDLLFQKMKEAGYEWDAEKKGLKKIEQSPSWSEEDETALCDALWCCKQAASIAKDENDMGNVWYAERWLKSLKDRFGCEVNCTTTKAWSEEDEDMLQSILDEYKSMTTEKRNWLKSIKERVGNFDNGYKVGFSAAKHNQWKPSEEQMKVLSKYAEQNNYDGSVLTSLYQDLKKLREE